MMDTPAKERNEPSYSSAHIFSNPALQGVAYTYIRLIHSFAYWVDRGSFNVLNSIFNKLNRDEASLITGLILLPFYLFGFLVEKTRCIIAATFFALSLVVFSLTLTAISTVGAIFSNLSNILLKPFNLDRKSLSTLEIINNMIWATIIDTCWYTFTASPQKIAAFFNNFYSRFILKKESRGTEEEDLNPPKYSFQQIMSILHAFVHFVSVVPPSSVYALLFYGKNNQETGLSKIIDHFINTPEAELKNADVFHLIKEWTLILSEQNPQPIVTILQNMKKHHLEALAQLVEIDGISNREIINCISEIKSPYWDTKSHTALQNFFKNILVIANAVDEKTSQLSLPLTSSAQFDILELALQQTQKITPVLHAAFTGPIGKLSVLFLRNSLENPPLSWPKERVQAISESITALQKKIQLNDLIELIAFFRTLLTELKKYNIRSLDQIITLSLDQRLQLIDTVLNNLSPRLIELFFLLDMSLIELALNALTDRTQSSELITRQEEFNRHTINQLKSLQKSYHENKTSWKSKYNATIKAIRLHINNINSHPDYWKSVSTKALKDDLTRRFMQHKGFSAGAIQDCLDGKNSIANLALNCFNDILNDSTKQQAKINQIKTILYRTPIIAYELDIAIGIKNPITTEKLKKTLEDKEFISRFIKERYPESRHDSLHEQIHRILSLLPDNSSESCIGDIRELCQLTFGTEEFATLEQSILVNDFNAPPINTKAQPILEINTDLAQRILCVLYHNDHHDNINQFIKEHPANLTKDVLLNKYGQDGAIIFDFLSTANEAEINLLEKELEVAKYDLSHRRLQSVLYRNPGMKLATLELSPTLLTPILDGTQFSNLQELLRVLHDNFSNNLYEYEALNTIFNNGNIKFDSEPSLKNRLGFFQSFTNTISTASDLIAFENTELTNETRVEKQQYLLAEAQERYSLQWSRDYSNQPTYNEHALLIQLISNERSRSFLEPLNHIYPGLRDRLNQIAYSEIQSITASKNWEESIAQEFGAMAVLSLKHQLACIHKEIQESVSIDTCKDIPISIDIQELFKYKEILQTKSPTVQRFLREEIEKANTQRALLHVINGAVLGVNPPFIECMQISWTPNNATPM
ncbi:MAG: hypothetical protein FJ161_03605, partial [Gammaproteobacteria bacterium]|nr:hypothetical protein [Gammaproteobacteria bacterium]